MVAILYTDEKVLIVFGFEKWETWLLRGYPSYRAEHLVYASMAYAYLTVAKGHNDFARARTIYIMFYVRYLDLIDQIFLLVLCVERFNTASFNDNRKEEWDYKTETDNEGVETIIK